MTGSRRRKRNTMAKHKNTRPTPARKTSHTYEVDSRRFREWHQAAAHAVALAVERQEAVCIQTRKRGHVVEAIDVTAAVSVDRST
jgi:hypothetical protein